ncbi:MAG: hypothetical protein WCI50_02640 [Actinomycetes bacterium]
MSGLWTPGGDLGGTPIVGEPASPVGPGLAGTAPDGPLSGTLGDERQPSPEEVEAMRQLLHQLASVPMSEHVLRHVEGLVELAALHLQGFDDVEPNPEEAAIAIDAIAGIVESLGDRLGPNAAPLRDLVAQLRLAWVQVQQGGPTAG